LEDALKDIMFTIPNLLDKSVPIGKDEDDNIEIKKHLKPTKFNFKPLPH
jgi:seryl-tRNA synthetase